MTITLNMSTDWWWRWSTITDDGNEINSWPQSCDELELMTWGRAIRWRNEGGGGGGGEKWRWLSDSLMTLLHNSIFGSVPETDPATCIGCIFENSWRKIPQMQTSFSFEEGGTQESGVKPHEWKIRISDPLMTSPPLVSSGQFPCACVPTNQPTNIFDH